MPVVTQIQFRRGTAAQWTAANPVLAQAELGYETDTGNFKIGNGTTAWNSLTVLNGITASTTATFTNKTFDTAGTGNVFRINGTQITAVTGSGSAVLATTPTLSTPVINNPRWGYSTTATAAGTTTLTNTSNFIQAFTGTTTQTVVMPVTSTLAQGQSWEINNNSTGALTVNSSGGNLIVTIPAGQSYSLTCIGTTLTTAADWEAEWNGGNSITGTGANVLATSPTLTTPVISSITNTGTLTLPTSTDTLVGRATSDTLTNKTISGANNTLSNIGNASLTNSSVTVNGTAISLGSSGTVTVPIATGVTGLGAGVATFLATPSSANLASAVTDETGSGALVFATSPTLTTPNIGVASGTSFNSITGLSSTTPLVNGTAAVGTGTTTARADHVHPTDTSRAATSGTLAQFAATTSAQLAGVISDETGTGALVFANTPTLVTPNIGVATGTSFNSITGLSSTNPAALGTVAVGTGTTTARADHVHPTTGLGLTASGLNQFAATTSAQLAGVISDETGSGALVFGTSPTIGGTLTASGQINMTATNAVGNVQDFQALQIMDCI